MANPGDFAYTVKQQADIVRIVGDYVKLKKTGTQNYSGLCPFHGEKTPSFSVHATRQFFHCFGCQASGDVFSFVQKIENITFPEAVRAVAQKVGIAFPKASYSSPAEAKEAKLRTVLLEVHERAAAFFQECLGRPEGARAREYLAGRGSNAGDDSGFPHRLCAGFRISAARSPERRVPGGSAARERIVFLEAGGQSSLLDGQSSAGRPIPGPGPGGQG